MLETKLAVTFTLLSNFDEPTTKQKINMSKDTYEYMVSTPTNNNNARIWVSLPIAKRLHFHLNPIKEYLGALSYKYEILDT